LEFRKIVIQDWHGKYGQYEIIYIKQIDNKLYSVTFVNSEGDIEKACVHEQYLYQ